MFILFFMSQKEVYKIIFKNKKAFSLFRKFLYCTFAIENLCRDTTKTLIVGELQCAWKEDHEDRRFNSNEKRNRISKELTDMRQHSKKSLQIRNMVIVCDFIVLNLLFYLYVYNDWVYSSFANGCRRLFLCLMANTAFMVAQYFFSTVLHERLSTSDRVLRQVTLLVLSQTATTYLITSLVFGYEHLPEPDYRFTALFAVILYFGILLSRYFERKIIARFRRMGHNSRRVVFVGSNPQIASVYEYLSSFHSSGYCLVGYYADSELENCPDGLKHCGSLNDFFVQMNSSKPIYNGDELYCALSIDEIPTIRKIVNLCNDNMIHFYYIPAYTNIMGRSFYQEAVGDVTVLTNYGEPLMIPFNRMLKRTFDVVVSSVVLLCLLPFIPIIAFIIKRQSPGPIFFKQERTGLDGRSFYCYKFRSMHVNANADRVQCTEHDPRKFGFGNFMRKTNIDEFPQFFNVLKGDMSIVGPRPHMLYHTETYRKLISEYMVRHFVRPGITGWAQVTGFRGETKELWQMEGRVKRDIWYIENWSFWLDLRIIWKTAMQIFVHDEQAY
jgi:putative colanic acid biosysnthesis UDP-glucose lipid carrier transferase